MRSRILSLAIGVGAAVAIVAGPVVAAGSAPVTITLAIDFNTGTETFTASGGFCPAGSGTTTAWNATGGPSPVGVFHVGKTLTCSDGSGSLTIELDAVFTARRDGTIGGWRVTGGSDDYAGAKGGGQIVGAGTETGIIDTYRGVIVP